MAQDRHKVSVVIPTLGRETLTLCREALAKQTRLPDEVIVVFDHHRQGVAWTRNKGIARAAGDLIAFTDDDAVPPADWLERLVGALDRHQAAVAGGTFQETDPLLNAIRCRRPFPEQEQIDREGFVGNGGNLLIQRQWLDACMREDGHVFNPYFTGSGEDWELIWRLRKRGAKMVYVPVPVTHLRRVTAEGYLRHSFHRGSGIARLFRLMKSDETGIVPQDSLLWGQAGKKTPPRWFAAVWSKLLGPFGSEQFQSKGHFWLFWLGEKAQAAGFAWELLRGRRVGCDGVQPRLDDRFGPADETGIVDGIQLRTKAWFGDEPLTIDFPPSWKVVQIGPEDVPALSAEAMRQTLRRPIGTPSLAEMAKGKIKAVIIVDDLTRPTPAADLLPLLIEELARGGLTYQAITVMLAGGTHPPASADDMAKKVGSALPPSVKVMAHDSRGDLVNLGVSSAGLPLQLNRTVMACDLKIGVGCIYPHPIAGFSGGAKIILPAICGVETTRMMHDYLRGSRERGGSIHTELRRDMVAVARKVRLNFIANVTLNHRREISGLFAGDVVQAHEKGVRMAQQLYAVSTLPEADVVIADMYPFDTSWQFAQDRGMWPIDRARPNASRVVIAACPLGLGTHELFPVTSPLWSRIARRLTHFRLADLDRPFEKLQTVARLFRQKQHHLMVFSPGLDSDDLVSLFPHARWFGEWPALKAALVACHGEGPVTVAVYRCAPFLIPAGSAEALDQEKALDRRMHRAS